MINENVAVSNAVDEEDLHLLGVRVLDCTIPRKPLLS